MKNLIKGIEEQLWLIKGSTQEETRVKKRSLKSALKTMQGLKNRGVALERDHEVVALLIEGKDYNKEVQICVEKSKVFFTVYTFNKALHYKGLK
tara:strand:+ start:755 stop:1036 length:282 start_codon:yes stop_codon:yes gene_type:complete